MGTLIGIVCLAITGVAFIPLLGWLNWFAIPISVIGLVISLLIDSNNGKTMCIIAIVIGLVRLLLGGGVL